tara:strand:+ start:355 stop:834 length:480 start_codon:yes stop_codon:yes gene_type:complete
LILIINKKMEIILLEKVIKLGDPGDLVRVRPGYARNFLIPSGKAVIANDQNKTEYEEKRASLEEAEEERKTLALETAKKLESINVSIPVLVSEEGTLYGSVGTREIAEAIFDKEVQIEKSSVRLPEGILKELGDYQIDIELHPEVLVSVPISLIAKEEE